MKYIYIPFLFLFMLFAGLSCQWTGKPYPVAMQRAIGLLSTRPDSALYELSQLDSLMQEEPEEARMYYRLLTLAAEDKLMMAYYYQGSVRRDMNDALRAIDSYQRALKAGRHTQWSDLLISIYSLEQVQSKVYLSKTGEVTYATFDFGESEIAYDIYVFNR